MKPRILSTAGLSIPLATALAALLSAQSARAATFYWDQNALTAGFGNAGGTWDSIGSSTWNATANGDVGPIVSTTTTTADILFFGTNTASRGLGGGTITVGNVAAGTITFGGQTTGNVTLSGGSITLAATSAISVGAGGATFHTISSQLTGGGTTLTKSGNVLALSATNNDYTGATNVTAGGLIYRNTGAKTAGGTHTFSAGTTIGLGVATSGSFFTSADIDQAFGSAPLTGNLSNVVMNATTNVGIDTTAGNFTYATSVAGSPTRGLTKYGTGTLTLTGANTFTGVTNVHTGTLRLESTAAIASSASISISPSQTLQLATDTAFSGPNISSTTGNIVSDRKTAGAGLTHTLGNLTVGNGNLNFTAGTNVTSGTAAIQVGNVSNDNGSVASPGFNPTSANLIITGGVTLGVTNAGTSNFNLAGTGSVNSIAGAITNGTRAVVNFTKSGSSTWSLSGANTYSGGTTTISGGTLVYRNLGAKSATGGTHAFAAGTTLGLGVATAGSFFTSTDVDNAFSGTMTGNLSNVSVTATTNVGIDTTAGDFTYATSVLGSPTRGLEKLGANTLTVSGANTYTGATTISAGKVLASNSSAFGVTGAVTLGNSDTVLELANGITINRALTISNTGDKKTLALQASATSAIYSGAITNNETAAGNFEVAVGTSGTLTLSAAVSNNTLTKVGPGTLILSGSTDNSFLLLNATAGEVHLAKDATANIRSVKAITGISSGATVKLAGAGTDQIFNASVDSGVSGLEGTLDLNGASEIISLLNGTAGVVDGKVAGVAGTNTLTIGSSDVSSSFGGVIKNTVGTLSLTKTGTGTQTLSGASTYSGATAIQAGNVSLSGGDNRLPTGTALSLGSGTTVGGLNLGNFNQTVSSLRATSDSANANTLAIGDTKKLTVTNGVTIGFNSAANTTSKLTLTGLGELEVTGGNFQVGGSTTNNFGSAATLDMSGLAKFTYNNSAGLFRVGDGTNADGGGTGSSTLILADTSTITANQLTTNTATAQSQFIRLGSVANTINATLLDIGLVGGRTTGGSLVFDTSTGSLKVRATDTVGRANMRVGYASATTTGNSLGNVVDLTGANHSADLLLGTLQIAGRTANNTGGATTAIFSFENGTLDATSVELATRAGSATATGAVTGTLNLGGGIVTIGASGLVVATNSANAAATTAAAVGTVNITGGVVNIGNTTTSIRLGQNSVSGNGGSTADLNITGGSLTVAGDIAKGTTTGTVTSTIKLSGGTLDMGSNDIGATGAGAITLTAESGILKNVATINGSGGLTKTTAGTLTLDGLNSYSGMTTVNEGSLIINGNQSTATGAVDVSNSGSRLMGTGTVGGATTINAAAIHSAGNGTGIVGNQNFSSSLTYANGSIFEWDINANSTATGFDTAAVTGALNGSTGGDTSIFRVVFGTTAKAGVNDSGNAFWNTPFSSQEWSMTSLFGKNFTSGLFTSVQTYDSAGAFDVSSKGSFTITGSALTWSAVPEPTTALAGLLLGAGLLRRRRNVGG